WPERKPLSNSCRSIGSWVSPWNPQAKASKLLESLGVNVIEALPEIYMHHLGIDPRDIAEQVDTLLEPSVSDPGDDHIPFTPRSKTVLELTLREALAAKHRHIGTEHIFVALLAEGEGVAAQVLRYKGFDTERSRDA